MIAQIMMQGYNMLKKLVGVHGGAEVVITQQMLLRSDTLLSVTVNSETKIVTKVHQ